MESMGSIEAYRRREKGKDSGTMRSARAQSKQPSGSQGQGGHSSEEYETVREKEQPDPRWASMRPLKPPG